MKKKELYTAPEIETTELDNQISLQLASDLEPMGEPDDWVFTDPLNNTDPFGNHNA